MDLQVKQRRSRGRPRKIYKSVAESERAYLRNIFNIQRCDANPRHRNIPWSLTLDEWIDIVKQDCYLCGSKPSLKEGKVHSLVGSQVPISGLDRLDNTVGYHINNIKPCCSKCNYMKHYMNREEFLSHVELIWRHEIANL